MASLAAGSLQRDRSDPLVSPARPSDTGGLNGIAPALLVTAEFDLLRPEGEGYAGRPRKAGALVDHVDVPKADHGYDGTDDDLAREIYAVIAREVRQTVGTGGRGRLTSGPGRRLRLARAPSTGWCRGRRDTTGPGCVTGRWRPRREAGGLDVAGTPAVRSSMPLRGARAGD